MITPFWAQIMINLIHVGIYGGLTSPWSSPDNRKKINFLLSFDPLYNKKCEKERKDIDGKHMKYAVFHTDGEHKFNVLKKTQCSSLYEPNYDFIKQYYGKVADKYVLRETRIVNCVRLDSVLGEFCNFDFIAADTQGADFDVVQSAGKYLDNIVGLHLELYLYPFYKDAVLFEEANRYFESCGFYLAKRLREKPQLYDNFVYLRKSSEKQEQLNLVKKMYGVSV